MSILDNPPHKVTIKRPRYERDQDGVGRMTTLVDVSTNVSSWIQNASSSEIMEYQKRDQRISDRVSFFGTRPDIMIGDVIEVTSAVSHAGVGTHIGESYTVMAMPERTAGYGLAWTAYCDRERP